MNALIVVVALGTTVAVVATDHEPTTDELEERASNLLPTFQRSAFRSATLKSNGGGWAITARGRSDSEEEPTYALDGGIEADLDAVGSLLRALELAGYVRRLTAANDDRNALGLEPPEASLTVELTNGRYELRFGKQALTPAGTAYVEVVAPNSERAVYLVRSEAAKELRVSRDALRPRQLLSFAFSDVTSLAWNGVEVRRASGVEFVDTWNHRVRRDAVERLGLELARTKSVRFADATAVEKAIAADASALSVRISTGKSEKSTTFRLGGKCPEDSSLEALLRSTPAPDAACVPATLRRSFLETAANLRDDAPFVLHTDEVESMRVERKAAALELVRSEKGFEMTAPVRRSVELDVGNGRLEQLVRASGERVERPALSTLGLEPREGLVRLRSTVVEGTPRFDDVVEIGRMQSDGRLPVRRSKDGVVLLLTAEAAAAYGVDTTLLKSRRLFDFGPSDLSELTIVAGTEREVLRRAEDGFDLVQPKGFEHDGESVLDLVQGLATLTVDRWVAETAEPRHGLTQPKATLNLELRGETAPRRVKLTIGADTSGGSFGAIDSDPGVFVLPRAFVVDATRLHLSSAAFQMDPQGCSAIAIEQSGRKVLLQRRGDAFVADTLSPAAVERITRTLANLRPEAALHTGPARASEGFSNPSLSIVITPTNNALPTKTIRVGSRDTYESQKIFFARVDGLDATFALPAPAVQTLLDATAH